MRFLSNSRGVMIRRFHIWFLTRLVVNVNVVMPNSLTGFICFYTDKKVMRLKTSACNIFLFYTVINRVKWVSFDIT